MVNEIENASSSTQKTPKGEEAESIEEVPVKGSRAKVRETEEEDQLTEEETQPEGIEKELVQENDASLQKPSGQEVDPFIDSEEIPEYYANILGIRTGPYDVELVFGLTHPNKTSKALVRVRTSQKHFQAIGETIMRVIHEQGKAS